MEIFFHFGLYKTGSSFLQTTCARNRLILGQSGYFFPDSIREDDMMEGRISPGNGNNILSLLLKAKESKVLKLVELWKEQALKNGCNKILISDEALIHAFAHAEGFEILKGVLKKAGFSKVSCFCFLRDPIDHCLSTFKHRAKKGTIPQFSNWVENEYETMDRLRAFLRVYKDSGFEWHFSRYSRNSEQMASDFFSGWLNLKDNIKLEEIQINPSLSLSEIMVLQESGGVNMRWVGHIYKSLINLPYHQKAPDFELEKIYRAIAFESLKKYSNEVEELNQILRENGKDILIFESSDVNEDSLKVTCLSQMQVRAILDAITASDRFPVVITDNLRIIKRKMKRRIKDKMNR